MWRWYGEVVCGGGMGRWCGKSYVRVIRGMPVRQLNLLRYSGHMQTGGVRVFYGVSTVSRRCFGEGFARTRKVTIRLLYGECTGPYGACASTVRTRTC